MFGKKRISFYTKNENGTGVNLNLNEYQFNIYIRTFTDHGFFFIPAFCAIKIITTIVKLLNNLLIVRERIIIGWIKVKAEFIITKYVRLLN